MSSFRECVNPFLSRLELLNPGVGEVLLTEYLVQLAKVQMHALYVAIRIYTCNRMYKVRLMGMQIACYDNTFFLRMILSLVYCCFKNHQMR